MKRHRMKRSAIPGALLGIAVLLTGCDQADPLGAACRVDVTTDDLQQARATSGVPDCEPGDGNADLPDVALPCLGSDREMALSDVRGPAMINFWASNCGPCVKEMPALQEFHETYGDQVTVLGVDYLETYPAAAIELAERSGTTYPSLADPCGELQQTDLVISGLPVFVFVAEDGSTSRAAGGKESLEEIVEMVETKLDIDLDAGGR